MSSSLVFRSGYAGIHMRGEGVRLNDVRVVASQNVALWADGGRVHNLTTNVRADSANSYPFFGLVQNMAVLAPDVASQTRFLGNVSNLANISGGVLLNDTLDGALSMTSVLIGDTELLAEMV